MSGVYQTAYANLPSLEYRRTAAMDRQKRGARGRRNRGACGRAGGDPGYQTGLAEAGRSAAAPLALALLSAGTQAIGTRTRWTCEARRVPASGGFAAPNVGGRQTRVSSAPACGR